MINYVPQATGLGADGSPDGALLQALAARKKAQEMTPGQRLVTQASSSEPIYNKSLGYAKLAAGALGGFMQGQEARKQEETAKAGASNFQKLAMQYGATPEQAAGLAGLYMQNPVGASAIIKDLIENRTKPPQYQHVQTGTDLLGRPKYGAFDPRTGAVGGQGGAGGGMPRTAAPAGPAPSGGTSAPMPGQPQGQAPAQAPASVPVDPRRAEFTANGYPESAPLPPPGADAKTFYDEWSKTQAAAALPASADAVTGLRKEIQNLPSYKNISQAAPIYRAMYEAAGRDTKAADLNLVYGLGKIMDPGSVVREGEIVLANDTQGLQGRLNGMIASIQGEGRLRPEARMALMQEAYGRLGSYKQMFEQDVQQYAGIAKSARMDPAQVIPDFGQFYKFEAAGPPIPTTLSEDIAAARASDPQAQQAPAPQAGAAPSADMGILSAIDAEIQRRRAAELQNTPGSMDGF